MFRRARKLLHFQVGWALALSVIGGAWVWGGAVHPVQAAPGERPSRDEVRMFRDECRFQISVLIGQLLGREPLAARRGQLSEVDFHARRCLRQAVNERNLVGALEGVAEYIRSSPEYCEIQIHEVYRRYLGRAARGPWRRDHLGNNVKHRPETELELGIVACLAHPRHVFDEEIVRSSPAAVDRLRNQCRDGVADLIRRMMLREPLNRQEHPGRVDEVEFHAENCARHSRPGNVQSGLEWVERFIEKSPEWTEGRCRLAARNIWTSASDLNRRVRECMDNYRNGISFVFTLESWASESSVAPPVQPESSPTMQE